LLSGSVLQKQKISSRVWASIFDRVSHPVPVAMVSAAFA
jgi:hypothetical protein